MAISYLELCLAGGSFLRVLRLLRCLRPLRMINRHLLSFPRATLAMRCPELSLSLSTLGLILGCYTSHKQAYNLGILSLFWS